MVSIRFNGLHDRHRQEDGKKGGQEDEHKFAAESHIERSRQKTHQSKYKRPDGLFASSVRCAGFEQRFKVGRFPNPDEPEPKRV